MSVSRQMFKLLLAEASVYLRELTLVSKDDIPLLAIVALFYSVYRAVMCRVVLQTFAKILRVKNEVKFIHRTFDCIHYVVTTVIGAVALGMRPYWLCTYWAKNCGEFMGQNPNGFECTVLEKIYYMLFAAYYIVDLGYVWTVNEPKLILLHHFLTLSMVFACVVLRSAVTGLSIMLLHDLVDLPLYLGKVLLYLGFSRSKDFCLWLFVILCTWLRIINFPFIIKICIQVSISAHFHRTVYRVSCGFLCALYGLHLIWQWKILTNIWGIIKGQAVHDNRSDNCD
jgi:hypothetical protein